MTWTAQMVKDCIDRNDTDVCKAVVTIYRKQTKSEQGSYSTHETNGVGFNKLDAEILTSFAKQIIFNKSIGRRYLLSRKQMEIARKKVRKYAGQLAKIANGEI